MILKRIAVFFPGIGYTCDMPLLYYTQKICAEEGMEIRRVQYTGFQSGIRGNNDKMNEAFQNAFIQTEEILKDISWSEYDDILFVGKSIGTCAAAAYAEKYGIKVRMVSYTPLVETFLFASPSGIMFHGTDDPWATDTEKIQQFCEERDVTLYLIEGANHSLETGDIAKNIEILADVINTTKDYILGKGKGHQGED